MLTLYQPWIVNYKKIYFANKPSFAYGLNVDFIQSNFSNSIFGFKKLKRCTKIIDLTTDLEIIKSNFGKHAVRKIKEAIKQGIEFIPDFKNYEYFVKFYNESVKSKGMLKLTNLNFYLMNTKIIFLTACKLNEDILVMHSCLLDDKIKRIELYQSASQFRSLDDSKSRNLIGIANIYLTFCEIEYFKNLGYTIFDLGGYATDKNNEILMKINRFKDSFGGKLTTEYDFIPFYKYLLEIIKLGKLKKLTGG